MTHFLAYPIDQLPYLIVAILIAFTIHEWAHASVALAFGDNTAKNEGRLSLNPLVHVDLFGLLMIILIGFGWAKPVPINRAKLKKHKLGSILVTLAGPISNLLLAFIGVGIFIYCLNNSALVDNSIIIQFFRIFVQLNLVLFVFNLIPFPPLDGYQIATEFLPARLRAKVVPFEQYAFLIFLVIALTPLYNVTIGPIFHTIIPQLFQFMAQFFLGVFPS